MPRSKTAPYWVEQVRAMSAENPALGPGPIAKRLAALGGDEHRDDAPSERTVARILARFRDLPAHERHEYNLARWPESFEEGLLPWEAGAAVLEMLSNQRTASGAWVERPTVRRARWFWRATLAAPSFEFESRQEIARLMELIDEGIATNTEEVRRAVESNLARLPSAPLLRDLRLELPAWLRDGIRKVLADVGAGEEGER